MKPNDHHKKPERIAEIEAIKNSIMNTSILVGSLIGILAEIFTTYRAVTYGFTMVYFVQSAVVGLILIVAYYRKSLSLTFKVNVLNLLIVATILAGLIKFGFLISSKVFIVAMPLVLAFIMRTKFTVWILIGFILVYAIFGYLYSNGILMLNFDANSYVTSGAIWAMDIAHIVIIALGVLFMGQKFNKAVTDNFRLIKAQNIDLTDREKKYHALFEHSNDAVLLIDDEEFFECNERTLELFACTKEEIIGANIFTFRSTPDIRPTRAIEIVKQKMRSSSIGRPQYFESKFIRKSGEHFITSVSLAKVMLNDKEYLQAVLRDITDQKQKDADLNAYRNHLEVLVQERTDQLEQVNQALSESNIKLISRKEELEATLKQLESTQQQLVEKEKMASIGILASGVAHEINNPMNFIQGGIAGLSDHLSSDQNANTNQKLSTLLEAMQQGVDRVVGIVSSLNHFSKNTDDLRENCDIHQIIENCLAILSSSVTAKIHITKSFTAEAFEVPGNEGMLHQAMINLLNNAVQAIESEGTILITTRFLDNIVEIDITDNGIGMDDVVASRAIDPFYTTKDPGVGTGLGLSIAHKIVEDHSGQLKFVSKPHHGTTVQLILPASKPAKSKNMDM